MGSADAAMENRPNRATQMGNEAGSRFFMGAKIMR
jgi:hypothetical protein